MVWSPLNDYYIWHAELHYLHVSLLSKISIRPISNYPQDDFNYVDYNIIMLMVSDKYNYRSVLLTGNKGI